MSAETFLLLTVLAQRARSRFFSTANALYKLLTYLLTYNPLWDIGNILELMPALKHVLV